MMNTSQKEKRWLEAWQAVAPVLEQERKKEIRNADSRQIIRATSGLVTAFYRQHSPSDTSGLVEQQTFFRKIHE